MARELGITVFKDGGKLNKGWAGHTVERYLGLPLNSSRSPNLGSWELKVVPLKLASDGSVKVKETMAITMLDPVEVKSKIFRNSHLFAKLSKQIVVARIWIDAKESRSVVYSCNCFELEKTLLYFQVEKDYEDIREAVSVGNIESQIGHFVQARTKGAGHGSTSRAFYAKKGFVEYLAGIRTDPLAQAKLKGEETASPLQYALQPNSFGRFASSRASREFIGDCPKHAGQSNSANRAELEPIVAQLPPNQSGGGRHKCPYCAYEIGFNAGVKAAASELRTRLDAWENGGFSRKDHA